MSSDADSTAGNQVLGALPSSDYALLAPHLREMSLTRGAVLHYHGQHIAHVYFPQGGMVSIVVTMRDGTMVETATLGRANIVGASAAFGSNLAVGMAVVQLPGKASRIRAEQLRAAAQESAVIRDFAAGYNDLLLAQVQQSVACNALHGLEQRLCRWLLRAHDCGDGDTVPLTQEFLGEMLGVRRTSVTLAAQLLQTRGIISYRRGQIRIANRSALEGLACECYETIQSLSQKALQGLVKQP